MGSPVAIKVGAEFAEAARAAADAADRSLTGQVEHWAKLGRAIEALLPAPTAHALKQSSGHPDALDDVTLRNQVLAALGAFRESSPTTKRSRLGLDQQTRYVPAPSRLTGLIRIEPDGTRTRGVRRGKTFVPDAD